MKEKNEHRTPKSPAVAHHPIRQQMIAVLLGVCLVAVSVPMPQFRFTVQAAEDQEDSLNVSEETKEAAAGALEDAEEFIGVGEGPNTIGTGNPEDKAASMGVLEDVDDAAAGTGMPLSRDYVTTDDGSSVKDDLAKRKGLMQEKSAGAKSELLFAEGDEPATPQQPACGIISEDTVWTEAGVLTNGELIVMPQATLTINATVSIEGNVTIKGGGKIIRGATGGGFLLNGAANLTLADITLDGQSDTVAGTSVSMITVGSNSNLTLDAGCTIRNCTAAKGGGVYVKGVQNNVTLNGAVLENCTASSLGGGIYCEDRVSGTPNWITLNNATIRNCSAGTHGGGVFAAVTDVTINGGRYESNRTTGGASAEGIIGGGFIFTCASTLTINSGVFTNNESATKGGCIHHCGHENTVTYIYGGVFSGNSCSNQKYAGSGAIYNSTVVAGNTSLTLSGDVKFGDGMDTSGVDGIYLDNKYNTPRKIQLSDTLTYPVRCYLEAVENYVIAKGVNDYQLLRERDMKKILFQDVGSSGQTWYAVLDKDKNEVYLSTENPEYGYFVYYIKNGANGTAVTDDTEYGLDEEVTVKTGEGLEKEGKFFVGWNTEADGSGTMYREGDTFTLKGDTDLYAIFDERKQYSADFYSGSAGDKETIAAEMAEGENFGTLTAPEAKPMEGFEFVGWDESPRDFGGEIAEGEALTLTENAVYYGVYKKQVTLSYDANGGDAVCPDSETADCFANVSGEISYDLPQFTAAGALTRSGYVFAGWNTKENGKGRPISVGEEFIIDADTTLYAIWIAGNETPYRVEHYRQDLEGSGYTRVDTDTEYMAGKTGDVVEAEANPYTGFTEKNEPGIGKPSGTVEADGSLVLQLYYDRDIYTVNFDLNGGEGIAPDAQSVRYGGYLQETAQPQRRGYTFKGWYLDAAGTESAYWDIYRTVEENTDYQETTLYAKWEDDIAPVLGEASFGYGYKNLTDWIISQKKLIITVPVTEEGSGLRQGDYSLVSENGERKEGTAKIRADYVLSPGVYARSGGMSAVMTIKGDAESGQSVAEITIAEEFKGSVFLTCTDNAGNTSVEKILTTDGAGAIVEDNAPDIRFSMPKADKSDQLKARASVNVDVSDSAEEQIAAGLAAVSYQLDDKEEQEIDEQEFADAIVEDYSFTVNVKGEGKHTLRVTAMDNAGNKTTKKTQIEITKKKAVIVPKGETPTKMETPGPKPSGEPKTGENTFVKIFATLGMVAGFTYLLLYFTSGENGITEGEKEEIISKLVRWSKKGKFRKYPALILILLFLLYYHSIGKSVSDEWRKVCEG